MVSHSKKIRVQYPLFSPGYLKINQLLLKLEAKDPYTVEAFDRIFLMHYFTEKA